MAGTVITKGVTTIVWGSANLLNSPSGAIVETLTFKPRVDTIEIEGNAGFSAAQVVLDDGFDAEARCLFDSNKSWPAVGNTVGLKMPNNAATTYNCLLTDVGFDVARKKEATISLTLRYRPDIALS